MSALNKLEELAKKDHSKSDDELFAFYDTLPVIDAKDMFGKWHGDDFKSGHWATQALIDAKWYGKWFRDYLDVVPLVCYNDEGKLFSNKMMNGEATVWNIEFRGKSSATMSYEGVPIFDHFRKVDDNTVMGVMNGKHVDGSPDIVDKGRYYFFYLKRISEYPAEFVA